MAKPEAALVKDGPVSGTSDGALQTQTTPLSGGLANVGMYKHKITTSLGPADPITLVEKRMAKIARHQTEFDICKSLARQNRYGHGFSPLAQILSVSETDKNFTIVMPFYEGVGTKLEDWRTHAKLFAQAVKRLNQTTLSVPTGNMMLTLLEQVKAAIQPNAECAAFI
ncbi:MAG: hypothetical protein ACPGVS_04045 [Primorskyibacter sp.]